jgi:hypothetical protein
VLEIVEAESQRTLYKFLVIPTMPPLFQITLG